MRYVLMDDVRPGMVLGRALYNFSAGTLLSEGKELTGELIERLKERGYPGIYIDDDWSKGINIEEVITTELRCHAVTSLLELDVDATMETARNIVDQILKAETVSIELMDLRSYDDFIYRHSVNVAVLSTVVGMGMGYRNEELVDLSLAAIFHDLGKILIDKHILNKPGKLNPMENEVVKRHPQVSYDMLYNKWDISDRVKEGVLAHHENEDGSGYPKGLSGDEIHPFAKIIHVADVYDALSSKRPYKEACSFSESYEYLLGGCGTLFNQGVVEIFSKYVPIYPKGMLVELSNGQEALVMKNYHNNRLRPKVRLRDGTVLDLQDESRNRNITILRQAGMNALIAEGIEANEKGRKQRRAQILVIDDDTFGLRDIGRILEGQYNVTSVRYGLRAIEAVKKRKPDLIIMDICRPDWQGIRTIRRIKKEMPSQIPVIFISALEDFQTVLECRNIIAADYVVKPYEASFLLERVRMIVGE